MEELIDEYRRLEGRIQGLIRQRVTHFCSLCTSCCCTAEICEETRASDFLSRVAVLRDPEDGFSENYGWLDVNGCLLQRGRPPVCYDFFCHELRESFGGELDQYVMQVIGRVLSFAGSRALGSRHLTELSDSELAVMNTDRVLNQIKLGHEAVEAVEDFFSNKEWGEFQANACSRILQPRSNDSGSSNP